jgi:hypothetical protein
MRADEQQLPYLRQRRIGRLFVIIAVTVVTSPLLAQLGIPQHLRVDI